MSHHFTRNITETLEWCRSCGRLTKHKVSDGRLAHCLEHGPKVDDHGMSKSQAKRREHQEREKQNPRLF